MTDMGFAAPASTSGVPWEDLNGALLIISPYSVEQQVKTVHGFSDAVRADLFVVDGPLAGTEYLQTLVFPKVLQGSIRPNIGKRVLGRLYQGQARPGQDPPWMLAEAAPADLQAATAYMQNRGAREFRAPQPQQAQAPAQQYAQPPQAPPNWPTSGMAQQIAQPGGYGAPPF